MLTIEGQEVLAYGHVSSPLDAGGDVDPLDALPSIQARVRLQGRYLLHTQDFARDTHVSSPAGRGGAKDIPFN